MLVAKVSRQCSWVMARVPSHLLHSVVLVGLRRDAPIVRGQGPGVIVRVLVAVYGHGTCALLHRRQFIWNSMCQCSKVIKRSNQSRQILMKLKHMMQMRAEKAIRAPHPDFRDLERKVWHVAQTLAYFIRVDSEDVFIDQKVEFCLKAGRPVRYVWHIAEHAILYTS